MKNKESQKLSRHVKERRRKLITRTLITFFVLLLLMGGYYGYTVYETLSQGYRNAKKSNLREKEVHFTQDPFAILIMGTDGRDPYSRDWRPDTIMVITINPKAKSMKMVSIPRDLYTDIANTHGVRTKINAAAHWGYQRNMDPLQNVRETVENLLHIPIDYYVRANFAGFTTAVDLLGGVDVYPEFPFKATAIGGRIVSFNKTHMHLNGSEALAYVRMRKQDPKGDHGRNKRQQAVLSKLADKLVSFQTITKFNELTKMIGRNITYSIKLSEIPTLSSIYNEAKKNQEIIKVETVPFRKNGIWYEQLPENERSRIVNKLQHHLQFQPTK